MRSLLILIFSAVLTYGIPIHAQETIDANLPPVPPTHIRTLFIFPVVDQSNPLEDAEQNPTPSSNSPSAPPSRSGTVPIPDQTPSPQDKQDDSNGKQTKRMLWVVPNFAAVDANKQLPPLSTREKFVLAARDSVVDYSSYTWTGILAGQAMLLNSDPELLADLHGRSVREFFHRGYCALDRARGPTLLHHGAGRLFSPHGLRDIPRLRD